MFEHYLTHHRPDRRRRLRMVIAAHLAGVATFSGLGFTWLMGKLQIAQVAPPSSSYVLVQMSLDNTPLPPPIPAAPKLAEPEQKAEPEEPDDETPPEDVTEVLPPPKPRTGPVGNGAPTATGTAPIGVPGVGFGIPGVNRVPGFIPTGTKIATAQPTKQTSRPPVPLSAVRSQAIYTPDPDRNRLAATRAGMFDKRPGENETGFCVDSTGRTTDVRTVKPFPGDPQVDEVIRATIKTWRFRPFMVEGKAIKTCTSQVFRISFK